MVDAAAGRVAFVDTDDLAVADTRPVPTIELPGIGPVGSVGDDVTPIHIALTADRLAVAAGDSLVWLDRTSLAPLGTPESLLAPVRALTSQEQSVLVWPADDALVPYVLMPPSSR